MKEDLKGKRADSVPILKLTVRQNRRVRGWVRQDPYSFYADFLSPGLNALEASERRDSLNLLQAPSPYAILLDFLARFTTY